MSRTMQTNSNKMFGMNCRCLVVAALMLIWVSGMALADLPPVERQIELAGNSLSSRPFFERVKAFN